MVDQNCYINITISISDIKLINAAVVCPFVYSNLAYGLPCQLFIKTEFKSFKIRACDFLPVLEEESMSHLILLGLGGKKMSIGRKIPFKINLKTFITKTPEYLVKKITVAEQTFDRPRRDPLLLYVPRFCLAPYQMSFSYRAAVMFSNVYPFV